MLVPDVAPRIYRFAYEVMIEMEKRKMTCTEAETFVEVLKEEIVKNNERVENSKPFLVFKR